MELSIKNVTFLLALLGYLTASCEAVDCSIYRNGDIRHIKCPYGCCGKHHDRHCCNSLAGIIVGSVVGCLILVGIVATIVACCFCACCPGYRYRAKGTIISTQPGPNYQTMPGAPYPPYAGQYQGNTGSYPPSSAPYITKAPEPPASYQV